MGKVLSVNISKDKQNPKKGITSIDIDLQVGVEKDAHEGASMQVSILPYEAVNTELGDARDFPPGCFAENITTQGIDLSGIKVGDLIKAGKVILKVVQLGKHVDQSHTYSFKGRSLLPKYGIFANVIKPGRITRGDEILIIEDTHSDENL
ncbi:MAG: MOSC domain-containing protein [Thermodesulfobacteriota bacterium]|nr:MOSC domain-containing protein [Thermodesulfobacteriota bacterium]